MIVHSDILAKLIRRLHLRECSVMESRVAGRSGLSVIK